MPSPQTARAFAPAQVTLAQHGAQVRLIVPAALGDEVTALPGRTPHLRLEGEMAETVSDTERARLVAAVELAGGVQIHIDKATPSLDGGASLAAAILRAGTRLMGAQPALAAGTLGMDVAAAAMLRGPRVEGAVLAPVALPPLSAVLIDAGHATPGGLTATGDDGLAMPGCATFEDTVTALSGLRNGYEPALRAALPELEEILDELAHAPDCALARPVGATPVCLALFPDQATAEGAAALLAQRHPAWWVEPTLLS